jgi:hypothetical protein
MRLTLGGGYGLRGITQGDGLVVSGSIHLMERGTVEWNGGME